MIADLVKVFIPAAATFFIGIVSAPLLTHYLYKYKAWKKASHKIAFDGTPTVEFQKLHPADTEMHTPRMGGILIWASVAIVTLVFFALARLFPFSFTTKIDFLSRSQTWIPFFTLLAGSITGLANDALDILPGGERGIRLRTRLIFVSIISLMIGWWFYTKLGVTAIGIPLDGQWTLGIWIIPFFMLVSLALYASGVIDGIDGLSGGVFVAIFGAYATIAYVQNQVNLAAFCAAVVGALLAFLWFNIPPARFWMTETGTMGLTMTIAVIAFMTDRLGGGYGVAALPVIAFLLVITVLSNIIQVLSKKFRGKKVFRIAPLHHHFEAIGWPAYKVAMRYWVLAIIFAILGMTIALLK